MPPREPLDILVPLALAATLLALLIYGWVKVLT